jgi:hypothetical protein
MATKFHSDLRNLSYSSEANPLIEPREITLKRRRVRTGKSRDMLDPITNEVIGVTAVFQIEEKDDAEFVKVFAEGVKAAFNLTKTAYRVFHAVLDVYQGTRMSGGYVDSVYLAWFDGGLSGAQIDMSEYTFKRGLRELLDKSFLAPRSPNLFWVNPTLFFKGDRVAFVKEYRRKRAVTTDQNNVETIESTNHASEHYKQGS